ncbi:uncharacterized protein LOC126368021 [Pectinophora gossypiella]|uniref:uncharacterized protein LOC126368021 n=1 Tax=Pectinophora gossypiella TaxID=13191 RepID=UPI00214F0BA1|nr:uncharacterized protein LOC126368021 [Pectinophora gossypiella]
MLLEVNMGTTSWWCLVALTAALMIPSQALHLQKIENNPGLLPVKLGTAVKQDDKWVIIKVLDLSGIRDDINFNIHKYREFDKLIDIHKPYVNEFKGMKTQLDHIIQNVCNKFNQLVPSHRFKRGLIDPLGSLIKIITGNLDHNDALKYDKLLSELQGKQVDANKKLTIISKMLHNLVNSSETLQENTLILEERLKRIERIVKNIATKENNSVYATYVLGMYNLFISNFRSMYLTISEVETALAFSKVTILHQSIVNSTELLTLLQSISKTDNLVYPVNENNLIKIERTIEVKAYVKGNQVTFLMEVPLIDNNTYTYYRLYPLPIFNQSINRTTLIVPKYPFLLVKGSTYLPLASSCKEIAANEFICTTENIVPYPEDTCAEQLMKFQSDLSLCTPHAVTMESTKLQRVSDHNWILYIGKNTIFTRKCLEDISKQFLHGTYLLNIDDNCDIYIENVKLSRRRYYSEDIKFDITPVINLPEVQPANISLSTAISLKGINLDDLKQLSSELTKETLVSESENRVIEIRSVSIATVVLYVILPLILVCFIVIRYKSFILRCVRNHQSSESPDDFVLREGGVMQRDVPRIIQVRA